MEVIDLSFSAAFEVSEETIFLLSTELLWTPNSKTALNKLQDANSAIQHQRYQWMFI